MSKIGQLSQFEWNWQGIIVGVVLLGLLAGDMVLFGQTVSGCAGVAVIVVVSGIVLRFEIGRRLLHR